MSCMNHKPQCSGAAGLSDGHRPAMVEDGKWEGKKEEKKKKKEAPARLPSCLLLSMSGPQAASHGKLLGQRSGSGPSGFRMRSVLG